MSVTIVYDGNPEWTGHVPANPSTEKGRAYLDAVAANTSTSLRDRRQEPVVIPPPPVDEKVEVQKVQRHSFVAPEISAPEQVFRRTRR